MIKLICIDVDGTIVGTGGEVHPAVWEAATRALEAGVRLAVCSGRPGFGHARGIAERLDPAGWHSFQNGSSVVHLPTGRSRSSRMAGDVVRRLIALARRDDKLLELYSDTDYVVEQDSFIAREHARLLGVAYRGGRFESFDEPVVRAQFILGEEELAWWARNVVHGLTAAVSTSPVMPEARFVNMTPDGIDKSVAVRAIAGEYGFALEQVMYVGDGENDLTAMRAVGVSVAMANAEPEVLEVASRVVAHVDEGGLADAIALAC
ncbi:MAG TPA: HAD family hydrolase [Gemmatimonadaceae bacterium]|nr:HAD family hydrolase [Gemmatimonadaceae bacterium]